MPARLADVTGPDAEGLADLRWIRRAEDREVETDRAQFAAEFVAWARDHAASHVPFVYQRSGRLVAMAWLVILERIPGVDRWTRLSGHVQSVFVLEEHRNGGIGAELMKCVLEEASRRGVDYVDVHPSARSFPFYRRLGFGDSPRTLEIDWRP